MEQPKFWNIPPGFEYKGQRYIKIKGKKYLAAEFFTMTPQEQEAILVEKEQTFDFSIIDKVLDDLIEQWVNETDPLKREILTLKYDLKIETAVFPEEDHIQKLKKQLELKEQELKDQNR